MQSPTQSVAQAFRSSTVVQSTLLFALCVLAIVGLLNARLTAVHHVVSARRPSDETLVPTARTAATVSLGHREWAADIQWVRALMYFGETLVQHQDQKQLQRFADTIETLDPHFRAVYLWAATVSVYNTRGIHRDSVEAAIAHLERGLRTFPDDGEMYYGIGYNYFFELPSRLTIPAEKLEAKKRGAMYLRRAAALGHGPQWMALAAAEALSSAGMSDQAIQQLRDQYLKTEDTVTRERIEERIRELAGQIREDPFVAQARKFEQERLRSFPYVPGLLYLFVGPSVRSVEAPRTTK